MALKQDDSSIVHGAPGVQNLAKQTGLAVILDNPEFCLEVEHHVVVEYAK